MSPESLSLFGSFFSLLLIPCVVVFAVFAIGRWRRGCPWPSPRAVCHSLVQACGITVAVTVLICLVFRWTGFFDTQFFRPSKRDYQQHVQLGLQPEEVEFSGDDGTRLHGWFLRAHGDALGTVVVFHGSDRNITHTVRNTHWLTGHGFHVFVFDYRGYGRSEGAPTRDGVLEDGVAALRHVRGRSDVDPERIFLWGQSMGGQLAIRAATVPGVPSVRLVVAEATYANHGHHLADKLGSMGPLWLVRWGAWLVTDSRSDAERAMGALGNTPVLLVHGTADTGVRPYHSERLRRSATGPVELWPVEGVGHLKVFETPAHRERLVRHLLDRLPPVRATPGTGAAGGVVAPPAVAD